MSDRYRYPRARSPPLLSAGRTSLPINLSGWASPTVQIHEHVHVVPTSRREVVSGPRSSTGSVTNGGTITTTYKVKSDVPAQTSSLRETSRTRRSTLDSHSRPAIVSTATRQRPVIHTSSGAIRPDSPLKNPFRSSEEEYITVPATSRHGGHLHHSKRYSVTVESAAPDRKEAGRLHAVPVREAAYANTSSRSRPAYAGVTTTTTRHTETISDDYGEDGYGYTNPRELVQYDLNHSQSTHRSRRDSSVGERSRPTSITGYGDIVPRAYDARERGPPLTTRGFDKIRGSKYEVTSTGPGLVVTPMAPMAPVAIVEPVQRLAPFEPVQRAATIEPVEPVRRASSSRSRPQSMYENREPHRRDSRDNYYEVRDEDRRESSRVHRHDNPVEQRGFGIRAERSERADRVERPESRARAERSERVERNDRPERSDRLDRAERPERIERPESRARVDRTERMERNDRPSRSDNRPDRERTEPKEHKSRDVLTTGLGLAGAALGVNALKNAARNREERDDREEREEQKRRDEREEQKRREEREDQKRREEREDQIRRDERDEQIRREEREDQKRREYDEERRRREKEERSPDLGGREQKERWQDYPPTPRETPPRDPRDMPPPPPRDLPRKVSPPQASPSTRDSRERGTSRDRRERESERREKQRDASSEAAVNGSAIDARSDSSGSDEYRPRSRREPPARGESGAAAAPFNPKDTTDLFALKEALKSKDNQTTSKLNAEPASKPRTPRASSTETGREAIDNRHDLQDRRSRDSVPSSDKETRQARVVSPPREKVEEAPKPVVKGILRQPKEKFPEDPAPIREGVAPLKDAKKDGIPPDARWTKISRKLVNPEALEAGKERFEAREDFVIVLRVLSRDEVQGYAEVTQRIRASREELEAIEASDRRRARRERHERYKHERGGEIPRTERGERRHRRHGEERDRRRESDSGSDSTEEDDDDKVKMIEPPQKRATFNEALMSGGLGNLVGVKDGGSRTPVGVRREK